MQSNFQKTALWNNIIGNGTDADWAALKRQHELIQDEVNEILEGIEARDLNMVRDGFADTLVTVYGGMHRAGVDGDADFDAIHVSNMSKFDSTREDAELTQAKYRQIGVETEIFEYIHPVHHDETYFAVKSSKHQVGTDGKKYPQGKGLKSHRFVDPVLPEADVSPFLLGGHEGEIENAAYDIGFSTKDDDVSIICSRAPPALAYRCKVTFHRMATTGNAPVTVDVSYEMLSTLEDSRPQEELTTGDIELYVVQRIASRFFDAMNKVYPIMVFIDAVELLDQPPVKWTCRWTDEKNIMAGVAWEKVP